MLGKAGRRRSRSVQDCCEVRFAAEVCEVRFAAEVCESKETEKPVEDVPLGSGMICQFHTTASFVIDDISNPASTWYQFRPSTALDVSSLTSARLVNYLGNVLHKVPYEIMSEYILQVPGRTCKCLPCSITWRKRTHVSEIRVHPSAKDCSIRLSVTPPTKIAGA
jgi:hypothetical protein